MPVTGSSAPATDGTVAAPVAPSRLRLVEPAVFAVVVGVLAAVMFATHRAGHWWGDDWALYLRQAEGLVSGHPRRVVTENEFTVTMSRGAAFSPPLYPWGFPIVLAPFVAAWGHDIDRLAAVPVLSACAFACSWYLLTRRRVTPVAALAGVVAITISPLLLSWTELLQSEWTFMAVATGGLAVLDRVVASGRLLGPTARWGSLVGVGLLAAAAFSVRREGLAMIAAIGGAQLVAAWRIWRAGAPPLSRTAAQFVLPHVAALSAIGLLQVLLPSTVIPRYSGTSVSNVWKYRSEHVHHLLQIVGLERPWDDGPAVLGSTTAGWVAAVAFFALALVGFVLFAVRGRDAHLIAYAVVAFVIGASFRVAINRYVCTVGPVMLLAAMAALSRLARPVRPRWVAPALTTLAVAAIAAGNLANADIRIDRAAEVAAAGAVEWGPTHPDAVAMFAEVEARTAPDDVVAAPKARAMTWATGRPSVQVDDYRPLPDIGVALVVTEPGIDTGDEVHGTLLADERFERVWSNSRFSIFAPRP